MRLKTLVWTLLMAVTATVPSSGQSSPVRSRAAGITGFGRVPLTFEANQGQTAPQVKFTSRGPGYRAYLTSDGMVLSLHATHAASNGTSRSATAHPAKSVTLQFRLLGAASNPSVLGEKPQLGRVNYFIGNNPAKWRRNVPTYGQVRYKNIYRGIDLVYYGNHQQLEYDFAVAPNADPQQIQFEIKGASQIHIAADGSLVLETGNGELHFQAPIVYQESNGQRVPLNGGYTLKDASHIGFRVAKYDAKKPLVIDPVLIYSTYLGGTGDDQPAGIAVDADGNVYLAGSTDSTDFPLSNLGALPAGTDHVFIAKLDPTGSNLIYADYLGGSSDDYGFAVTLDASNQIYVTGSTSSSDFPMVQPFQGTYPGGFNAFLAKISADGSSLLYSTYFGGNGSDIPSNVAVDQAGNTMIAGYTSSTDLPVANAYQNTASPNQGGVYGNYGFLTKFTPDGSSLVYSTYFGGSSNVALSCGGNSCWPQPDTFIAAMTIDATGDAYLTGSTNTYNFPVTNGAYLTTNSTQMNSSVGFVSKFDAAGSLQYSTYLYGTSGMPVNMAAIAADAFGSAYVTGSVTSDGTFPVTSTSICDPASAGAACGYAFVTKFDAAGATLIYSTFLGPNNNATPQAIVLDQNNNADILASTSAGSFGTVNGIEPYSSGDDLLLVEIDASASTQLFATYLGGSGNDDPVPAGMVIDASGNLYITGITDSTDLPVSPSAFQGGLAGYTDSFILKVGPASAPGAFFNSSSLQYASLAVGSSSQPQSVLLRNMGSSALSISSITASGDFSETDNCSTSVPAAGSCTLAVTFAPTSGGIRSGSIAIQDDAAGSPHTISLSGTGLGAGVSLTPDSLTFSGVTVGTTSAVQTVTLANSGNEALTINGIQISGGYTQTNNCPASLAAGSTCAINVTFAPTVSGSSNGTITITDNIGGGSQTVPLTGVGSDFSITGSVTAATIKAGANATYSLAVAPVGGAFSSAVTLTCSGAPAKSTCSLSKSSVTPGSTAASITVTIKTAGTSSELVPPSPGFRPIYAFFVQLQGFGLFGMMFATSRRRTKKFSKLMILALLIGALLFMSACAGGTGIAPQSKPPSQTGTAAGTYTITVSGASGALHHSLPLTLTVQ